MIFCSLFQFFHIKNNLNTVIREDFVSTFVFDIFKILIEMTLSPLLLLIIFKILMKPDISTRLVRNNILNSFASEKKTAHHREDMISKIRVELTIFAVDLFNILSRKRLPNCFNRILIDSRFGLDFRFLRLPN